MVQNEESYYNTSSFSLSLLQSQLPSAGLGVFTNDYIPPHTIIDEYRGEVAPHGGPYVLEIETGYYIDARAYPRCYMGMINDCAFVARKRIRKKKRYIDITPEANYDKNNNKLTVNCEVIIDKETKRAYIKSIAEIYPGSELFISYGEDYWKVN